MSRLVHRLLEAAVQAAPEQTAVVDEDRELSYAELERRSNRLAQLLCDLGVQPGDRVGLYLDKSLESLVGIYGILKAGAVYVPFDPHAPSARLGFIARNADIRCLVTGAEKASAWRELQQAGAPLEALIVVNSAEAAFEPPAGSRILAADALASLPDHPPAVQHQDSDLAYILYTSGSTGEPKGVMLSHRNALAFVDWAAKEFAIQASDRLSSHAPLHFDLSVFDLFAAVKAGATTVLVPAAASVFPRELARFIDARAITVWYSVPSILSLLVLRGGLKGSEFPRLRTLLFAGEVFPGKYLFRLMELLPHVRFCNLYGPTETNVCTWYEVPRDSSRPDTIPIGKPISDVQVFAVDEDGRVAGDGEVGELSVVGPTVMQGYWGDPERTAQRLVPAPPEVSADGLMYRTGDLTKLDSNGDFLFFGRRDSQIKSRGYRIELGEIEAALSAHPSVLECAVAAIPDELVTNRIKAYVAVRDGTEEAALLSFCQERLPKYMIPDIFDLRSELPKSSTGKIARTALEPREERP